MRGAISDGVHIAKTFAQAGVLRPSAAGSSAARDPGAAALGPDPGLRLHGRRRALSRRRGDPRRARERSPSSRSSAAPTRSPAAWPATGSARATAWPSCAATIAGSSRRASPAPSSASTPSTSTPRSRGPRSATWSPARRRTRSSTTRSSPRWCAKPPHGRLGFVAWCDDPPSAEHPLLDELIATRSTQPLPAAGARGTGGHPDLGHHRDPEGRQPRQPRLDRRRPPRCCQRSRCTPAGPR